MEENELKDIPRKLGFKNRMMLGRNRNQWRRVAEETKPHVGLSKNEDGSNNSHKFYSRLLSQIVS